MGTTNLEISVADKINKRLGAMRFEAGTTLVRNSKTRSSNVKNANVAKNKYNLWASKGLTSVFFFLQLQAAFYNKRQFISTPRFL